MWPFPQSGRRRDLEERVEKLERAVRDLTVDWDSTYEKFSMLHRRLAKRDKHLSEAAGDAAPRRDLVSRLRGT
jgi:septation ring formation regulator EzrA